MPRNTCYALHTAEAEPGVPRAAVINNWDETQRFVHGTPGVRYKGFTTAEEAVEWLRAAGRSPILASPPIAERLGLPALPPPGAARTALLGVRSPPARPSRAGGKRRREAEAERKAAGGGAEGGKRRREADEEDEAKEGVAHVYTDGSCLHNGTSRAAGGIGVVFRGTGYTPPPDISAPATFVPGVACSNNRAELEALATALQYLLCDRPCFPPSVVVHVDNQIAIRAAQEGGDGANPALRARCAALHARCAARYPSFRVEHVKGHSGDEGNEAADAAAERGALRYETGFPDGS